MTYNGHDVTDPNAPLGYQCGDASCSEHGVARFSRPTTTKTITEAQLAIRETLDRLLVDAHGVPDEERDEWAAAIFAALPDTGLELTTAVVNPLDVERLARASHARCIAQWEADRQTDPDRMLTMHDWDAHVPATRKDAAEYERLNRE